ncbi:purine-binding chemotaxis protein CheW [Sphingomonas laterariae]|uniref:Purine-binding chemotaxis protein CheW n=1 Tax=Edaphosphingomonas laterariae TaxID=861865 RepID=A0A239J5G8_9SPHN|nr:chemotaxis protein CheW [Sphingomonas laterariae]SNS99894.1 purine-binding chemotaxis protein CheW [Sphingomonas laterariae]
MTRQLITFHVGSQCLGVDIMATREIRAWSPTTPIPQVPAFVRGIVNLRGMVLPVIDLSARLGWGDTEPGARHVIMVLQIGDRQYGLIVDAVNDIATIDGAAVQPPPGISGDGQDELLEGIVSVDGEMVLILDLERLAHNFGVPEEVAIAA